MKDIDARKLGSEAQQHNRNQAIADSIGVHYGTVCNWIRPYERDGEKGLAAGEART